MGCGRVGSGLARALSETGHEITVVDRSSPAFTRLGSDFSGRTVLGEGFDRDILIKAGIEETDAFAAVSSGDNSNIIAARVAREMFGVEHVVARIYDEGRAAVYERLGIPTIATVPWTTNEFLRAIDVTVDSSLWHDPTGNVVLTPLPLHESWVGRKVAKVQEATGARVAYLTRFGAPLLPGPSTVLQQEDRVFAITLSANRAYAESVAASPAAVD